jgi:hypothetical protein
VLKVCFSGRSRDLAPVLLWPPSRLYHDAEHDIDRLSYLDQGDTTESTTNSIARALFPCHQTDSRSVGKFVPIESGTCPACMFLKYKSGAELFRLRFIVRQMCLAMGRRRQIQLTIATRVKV